VKLWFALILAVVPAFAQVDVQRDGMQIQVTVDGKPFTTFYFGPDQPKPFLHPLRSASGKVVTRGFPMEKIAGEPADHPHHRGVFFGHGKVNGFNFWANEFALRDKTSGRVVLKDVTTAKGGKKSGAIAATFDWNEPGGRLILTEKRTMKFYSDPNLRVIDFDFLLIPNGKVLFGDDKEGFFAVRVHPGIQEEKSGGKMTNAEGKQSEAQVWGQPSNWVDYAGTVDGEALGIAFFDHPANLRHPERWHARGYGLFSVNPFMLSDVTKDKTTNADYVLDADKTLHLQYRMIIHPGDTASAKIEDLYQKYVKRQ
jgi:Methane oxygenase PmoA